MSDSIFFNREKNWINFSNSSDIAHPEMSYYIFIEAKDIKILPAVFFFL